MGGGLDEFTEGEPSEEVGSVIVDAEPSMPFDALADLADDAEYGDEYDPRTD